METVWKNPICINDGVFITSENGNFKMFKLERGSFILPIYGESFTEDMIEFIKEHYSDCKCADKDEYLKNVVDRTDYKNIDSILTRDD